MEKSKRTFRGSYPAYALTYFFFYWSLGVFTSVLSMYLTGIGKSKAEMSFIMSASSLFGVVLIPIVGYINDKLRKPRLICTVMMACVAVFGLRFGGAGHCGFPRHGRHFVYGYGSGKGCGGQAVFISLCADVHFVRHHRVCFFGLLKSQYDI